MAKTSTVQLPRARVTNRARFLEIGRDYGFFADEGEPVFYAANTKEARCMRQLARALTHAGVKFCCTDLSEPGATCIVLQAF